VGRSRRAAVLHPRPGAVFLNSSGGPLTVNFAWDRTGFEAGRALGLEIARDRAFSTALFSRTSLAQSLPVELENGMYYWRVYPEGQAEGGVSGRLSLIDGAPPELISPAPDEEFSFSTTRPGVRFLWASCEGAVSYLVEISANPGMADPVYQSQVQDSGGELSSIVYSGFESGAWYWRVRPQYPRNYEGSAQVSRTASFRIRRTETLAAPSPRLPAEQGNLYLEDTKGEVYFSWKQEEDAASYTFLLSRSEDLSRPLIEEQVQDNYFVYDLKSDRLAPGQYYWGVYQTSADSSRSAPSAPRGIVIMAGPPPQTLPRTEAGPAPAGISVPETPPPELPATETPAPEAPVVEAPASVRPAAAPIPPPPAAAENAPRPEPPPLRAPGNMRPAPGFVLTEELIVRDRQISFSWNAVPGAASYVFILYQTENGRRREILRRTQNEPAFTLTDLAILDRGTFIWRVEPRSRIAEQKAEAGESAFTVSIAETQASQGQESSVMFGN
jgi:hypothetical protein